MGKELRDSQWNPFPCRATATTKIQPETMQTYFRQIFQDKYTCVIATTLTAKGLAFTAASDLYSKNKTTWYQPHCVIPVSFFSMDLPIASSVEFCKPSSDSMS